MGAINQYILENPTHPSCIRADHRLSALWHTPAKLLDVLEDPRTCPVQVCAILKYNKHVRVAEHGLGAHGFHMRSSEQSSDNGISDLVLDHIRRASRPRSMHNDLHSGNVRQGIKRYPLQRPDAAKQQE